MIRLRRSARTPASRRSATPQRLRHTRWLLTALFTALTAACLIVLGAVAARIDANSRDTALDGRIDRVITGLAREVYWAEDGSADLEAVRSDEDLSDGSRPVTVLVRDASGLWREAFTHKRNELPADMTPLAREVAANGDTAWHDRTDRAGAAVRVAGEPVWNDKGEVGAVVVAGADPGPGGRDHRKLVLALELGGATLVALAALAGHLLSGVSMRPALRMLDEQERFLSEASHELRTPLATLRLYLDAALRDPADTRRAVTDARALTDRMGRLVTGLLARTRTESGLGELDLQSLHLDQLVEGVVAESGAEVTLHTEPTVVAADPDLLALAVRNLIDNAIVHGGNGIEVTVADGTVSVRDHGPGLDPNLTDPFARGETGAGGRHGIGLSLVQWVARAHHGSATIEPAEGGGVLATLGLPLTTPGTRTR